MAGKRADRIIGTPEQFEEIQRGTCISFDAVRLPRPNMRMVEPDLLLVDFVDAAQALQREDPFTTLLVWLEPWPSLGPGAARWVTAQVVDDSVTTKPDDIAARRRFKGYPRVRWFNSSDLTGEIGMYLAQRLTQHAICDALHRAGIQTYRR